MEMGEESERAEAVMRGICKHRPFRLQSLKCGVLATPGLPASGKESPISLEPSRPELGCSLR